MNLTDHKFVTLRLEGHTGTASDMMHQWLLSETGILSKASINDLWAIYLNTELIPARQVNDRKKS